MSRRDVWERTRDGALAATILIWAGVAAFEPSVWSEPVRVMVLAFNVFVGSLLLLRRPARREGSTSAILAAAPSLGVGFVGAALAPPPNAWPWFAIATFGLGLAGVVWAFSVLGRNFAILPALRGVVTGGPYRFVRHPAYACEIVMLMGCAIAGGPWWTALPFVVALPLLAVRIRAEERVLRAAPEYVDYTGRVRWRLVPFVW